MDITNFRIWVLILANNDPHVIMNLRVHTKGAPYPGMS